MQSEEKWSSIMAAYIHEDKSENPDDYIPHRQPGRPRLKWDDRLQAFCNQRWPDQCSIPWYITLKGRNIKAFEAESIAFACQM